MVYMFLEFRKVTKLGKTFNSLNHMRTLNLYHSLGRITRQEVDDMLKKIFPEISCKLSQITVDSRCLELQGTHWNTSRYPYFDISELREWGKQWIEQPHLTNEYVIWLLNLEIYIYNNVEKRRNCSLGAISPLFHIILLPVGIVSC